MSVFTTHLHWSTICCIAVAWQQHRSPFCPSGIEEGHAPSLLTHSPAPWQLHICRKGTFSLWKDGPPTTTPFFLAPFLYWHLVQEREVRLFVPFLLTDIVLRICTGHLQNKSPHQVCTFLRQKTDIFCGKQILKMHQIQYFWSPPSVSSAWFLRCHAKWMCPQDISS